MDKRHVTDVTKKEKKIQIIIYSRIWKQVQWHKMKHRKNKNKQWKYVQEKNKKCGTCSTDIADISS